MQKKYRLRSIGGKERQPLGAVWVLGERESINARVSSFFRRGVDQERKLKL